MQSFLYQSWTQRFWFVTAPSFQEAWWQNTGFKIRHVILSKLFIFLSLSFIGCEMMIIMFTSKDGCEYSAPYLKCTIWILVNFPFLQKVRGNRGGVLNYSHPRSWKNKNIYYSFTHPRNMYWVPFTCWVLQQALRIQTRSLPSWSLYSSGKRDKKQVSR